MGARLAIRWVAGGLVWLGCALAAQAQDGLAPVGGVGRSGARAGAGTAAADDPFAGARNPAGFARLRDPAFGLGVLGVGTDLQPRHTTAGRERRASGGVGAAFVWPLGGRPLRDRRDPFAVPLRAGVAWQALSGEGRIAVTLDRAPRLVELRARGAQAEVTELIATVEPLGGSRPTATQSADGGALYVADFRPLLRWATPEWPDGRGVLVVRYRWRFVAPDGGETVPPDARIEVRLDVDGIEQDRNTHVRPAPEVPTTPSGEVGAPLPDVPRDAPAGDAPDAALVRELETGGWRVGITLVPAAAVGTRLDAPGLPGGYGFGLLTEAGSLGLARNVGEHWSVGVALQLYTSALAGVELPVTMPDGFGGTQTGSLAIDRAVTAGVGGSAGLLWDPCPCLTVGLHYISRAAMGSHRGTAQVRGLTTFGGLLGGTTGEWDVAVRHVGLPQRAGVSAAWRPAGDTWLVVADCTWWDWSDQVNDIRFVLESPDTAGFQATGANVYRIRVPLNWEDRFTVAVGTTWRAWDHLLLHGGYSWGRNPYTAGATHALLPLSVRHHVSAGATLQVGRLTADVGVTAGLPESVRLTGAGYGGDDRLRVWTLGAALTVGVRF